MAMPEKVHMQALRAFMTAPDKASKDLFIHSQGKSQFIGTQQERKQSLSSAI